MLNPRATQVDTPRLAVCWLRACQQIRAQMAAGCELRDLPPAGAEDLESVRMACALWLHVISTMLLGLFANSSIAMQYDATFGEHSETNPANATSHAEFVRGMNAAITGLWSVMQRLEFMADPPGHRHLRWFYWHLIRQPIGQGLSQHYYLPC